MHQRYATPRITSTISMMTGSAAKRIKEPLLSRTHKFWSTAYELELHNAMTYTSTIHILPHDLYNAEGNKPAMSRNPNEPSDALSVTCMTEASRKIEFSYSSTEIADFAPRILEIRQIGSCAGKIFLKDLYR